MDVPTRIEPLPKDMMRGWKIVIEHDGKTEEIAGVGRLTIFNPKMGLRVTYGKSPNGNYDQPAIHNSYGSVIVPFVQWAGEIYIGIIEEKRMLQTSDGKAWNVPRGFVSPGQSFFEAAVGEMSEEVGVKTYADRLRLLQGDPGNPDSTFFETWGERGGEPEGNRFWSYEVFPDEVATGDNSFRFKETMKPTPGIGEKIFKCEFRPWKEVVKLGDQLTLSGVARLLSAIL